jgi:hypothetical protein
VSGYENELPSPLTVVQQQELQQEVERLTQQLEEIIEMGENNSMLIGQNAFYEATKILRLIQPRVAEISAKIPGEDKLPIEECFLKAQTVVWSLVNSQPVHHHEPQQNLSQSKAPEVPVVVYNLRKRQVLKGNEVSAVPGAL